MTLFFKLNYNLWTFLSPFCRATQFCMWTWLLVLWGDWSCLRTSRRNHNARLQTGGATKRVRSKYMSMAVVLH